MNPFYFPYNYYLPYHNKKYALRQEVKGRVVFSSVRIYFFLRMVGSTIPVKPITKRSELGSGTSKRISKLP